METAKSSVRTTPKPINVFYVWYTELCRRMNCTPTPIVKPAKPKCQTVLDFVADRLKIEDWNPIVNALRHDTSLHVISIKSRVNNCQFLHDVDTEEKAKHMKRRFGTIWTAYILHQLLKSLSTSLKCTEVLTCLELDGLPMFAQYLEPLLQALKKNKTIKTLSFANSIIKDAGCQLVCAYLRFTPNVEILNLTRCGLSMESGEHIAKLIKYQQINRYCESWHNSLRYENPQADAMRGIKRITLNCNPGLGDDGLNYILDELEDDLWIKAIDVQNCNLTENITRKIIDILQYTKCLEIFDVRQNEFVEISTLDRILQILKNRQPFGYQSEFQWCNTAVTLSWNSINDSASKLSFGTNVLHKSISAPGKRLSSTTNEVKSQALRKCKTMENIHSKKSEKQQSESQITELNLKLKSEMQKRREIEKRNEELKQQLEKFKCDDKSQPDDKSNRQIKTGIHRVRIENKQTLLTDKTKVIEKINRQHHKEKSSYSGTGQEIQRKECEKAIALKNIGMETNGYKNGYSSKIFSSACKILENLLKKENCVEDDLEEQQLLHVLKKTDFINKNIMEVKDENQSDYYSESHTSLYTFMEELKQDVGQSSTNYMPNYISK